MRHVICDICGSERARLFAERPARDDVLHARFVQCSDCGFVYANPRAERAEAERFYSAVVERGSGSLEHELGSREWARAVQGRRNHLWRAAKDSKRELVRFLDVGFGDGSALAAAEELGWASYGLEYADWLVRAARERQPSAHVAVGDVTETSFDPESFDVVYAWHCIEHVLDVNGWLLAIRRLMKPGGVLIIGTENAEGLQGRLHRLAFRLAGRKPWPPTSTDHTYWFSPITLGAALDAAGLFVSELSAYENTPTSILRGETLDRLRNPRWVAQLGLYLTSAAAARLRPSLGGKLVAMAIKPGAD